MPAETPTLDSVQNYWNTHPAGYAEVEHLEADRLAFFDERDRQTRFLHPRLDEQYGFDRASGKRALELGCGMGYNAQRLAQCGARLVAMDLAPKAVLLTRERFALRGLPVHLLIADAEHLPFAEGVFELIFSSGVIHHSPDTQAAAREIVRILQVGGAAAVMIYHRDSIWFWWNIVIKLGALMIVLNTLPPSFREPILARRANWEYYILPPGRRLRLGDVIRAGTDFGGVLNPVSRVYTRGSARRLFSALADVRFVISDASFRPFDESPAALLKVGRRIKDWLNRRWGFYLTVHGIKPAASER